MAIMITSDCINCGACEPECPNNAIYANGAEWGFSDGTKLSGTLDFGDGLTVDAGSHKKAEKGVDTSGQGGDPAEFYYIVTNKCTNCVGFHDEPQCASVCPVDCCIDDPDMPESKDDSMAKKKWLWQED